MAFHHVALASRDTEKTHRFYTEVMGFSLVRIEAAPAPDGDGSWAKHFFYDTGAGMIAFWELHGDAFAGWKAGLAKSVGLPAWVNHLAFDAPDLDALDRQRQRWQEHGITVAELDHGWCRSIYCTDPNGILVEFCTTTREFTDADKAEAEALLFDPAPPLKDPPAPVIHPATGATASAPA